MITLIEEQQPWTFKGKVVVVDTSVLVPFALETDKNHLVALSLFNGLIKHQIRIRVPFNAAFEFLATMRRSILFENAQHAPHAHKVDINLVVNVHAVPINNTFVEQYKTTNFPHLKGGDLIFLALAYGDHIPLITEDKSLYKKGRQVGVNAYKISEYLLQLNHEI